VCVCMYLEWSDESTTKFSEWNVIKDCFQAWHSLCNSCIKSHICYLTPDIYFQIRITSTDDTAEILSASKQKWSTPLPVLLFACHLFETGVWSRDWERVLAYTVR